MSPAAGYIGAPRKAEIPALCGSCHANVELMRQFDLPTDQYAKYRESQHGKLLAQGDQDVATCFECHGGHAIKKKNEPTASVYPTNVPALCASCHADKTLMRPYGIPTNQYDLFRASVHGIALLQKQGLRAPSCATCHGTHGAAPPGFAEVANVCGSCHSATQDYYLKSKHASGATGTPKRVTRYGRYDVFPATDEMFLGTEPRRCGSCHPAGSPQRDTVDKLYQAIASAAKTYDEAETAVRRAAGIGMIVAPEEAKLREAQTSLITARRAAHNAIAGRRVVLYMIRREIYRQLPE